MANRLESRFLSCRDEPGWGTGELPIIPGDPQWLLRKKGIFAPQNTEGLMQAVPFQASSQAFSFKKIGIFSLFTAHQKSFCFRRFAEKIVASCVFLGEEFSFTQPQLGWFAERELSKRPGNAGFEVKFGCYREGPLL